MYNGAEPESIKCDIFKVIISLTVASIARGGPETTAVASTQVDAQVDDTVTVNEEFFLTFIVSTNTAQHFMLSALVNLLMCGIISLTLLVEIGAIVYGCFSLRIVYVNMVSGTISTGQPQNVWKKKRGNVEMGALQCLHVAA